MADKKGIAVVGFPVVENIEPTIQDQARPTPRSMFTSGTIPSTTVINIGVNNVKIDGSNKRITINDGTNDIVLIGYLSGGF